MSTRGNFTGTRESSSTAAILKQLRKIEISKGGKLPLTSTQRYKMILNKRMEEHRKKSQINAYNDFTLGKGQAGGERKMSRRAEMALKEIARKKAVKEAKELRQMVVIKPRHYGSAGQITAKGIVYDHVNNITMRVDTKNGKIKTMGGFTIGKYKPKSAWHDSQMQTWIRKYSPYHLKLQQMELQRQIQAMYQLQQAGGVTVHGMPYDPSQLQAQLQHLIDAYGNLHQQADHYGNVSDHGHAGQLTQGQRTNMGVTAWGVQSNNVWGTFGENTWGGFAENVWGRTNNNIWGGIGDAGNFWRTPGRNVFRSGVGTGQKNYIGMWGGMLLSFMGLGGRRPGARTARVSTPGAQRGGRR